ncbi:uncharacterized protein TOL2_C33340 [Desulfobacula toluolica Tol2]|uniref:Uncharacterized protein n=1 Tax=Desulfobacula toluolica (strain DSM 7467 / Tol2) TaxID=651182 RepID=K0NJ49_DESTT|nr:uncharacterized protein TOL2_C33340 [Desulfobacula toluolica Tol2]
MKGTVWIVKDFHIKKHIKGPFIKTDITKRILNSMVENIAVIPPCQCKKKPVKSNYCIVKLIFSYNNRPENVVNNFIKKRKTIKLFHAHNLTMLFILPKNRRHCSR